jgi:hypothetical protein
LAYGCAKLKGILMAKGQKRGNREIKKPKAPKAAPVTVASTFLEKATAGTIKKKSRAV